MDIPDDIFVETPQTRVQIRRKTKHPKRKPKGLRLKPRVEISMMQMRGK